MQGTGVDRGTAAVGVGAAERQRARTILAQAARAGNRTGIRTIRTLVEDQRGIVGDVALQARRVALQGTGVDRGTAAVGVGTAERQRTRAILGQAARAGNHASIRTICTLIEHQGGVVRDVALQAGAVTLQRARADGRAAAVGVGATEHQGTCTQLGQAPRSREGLVHGEGIGRIGDIEPASCGPQGHATRCAGVAGPGDLQHAAFEIDGARACTKIGIGRHRQRTRTEFGALGIGIGTRENQRACAGLLQTITRQHVVDRRRPARTGCTAITDANLTERTCRGRHQTQGIPIEVISVAGELDALRGDRLRATGIIDRHGACRTTKDHKRIGWRTRCRDGAVGIGPVRIGL